jgi:hypothetical protein
MQNLRVDSRAVKTLYFLTEDAPFRIIFTANSRDLIELIEGEIGYFEYKSFCEHIIDEIENLNKISINWRWSSCRNKPKYKVGISSTFLAYHWHEFNK